MGASFKTPYQILGVPENADQNKIRLTFRDRIHELKQGKLTNSAYRDICRAYECLSDDNKRQIYDESKKWFYKISYPFYTLQQIAGEPSLLSNLKQRLNNANLREINAQDPVTGHTALYCAARAANIPAVLYLIEKGADPDLSQRTQSTALHVGAFYQHPEVVRCLLECGADYRLKNVFGNTAEAESSNDVKQVFLELKKSPFVRAAANELDWFKDNIHNISQHIDEQYFINRQTLLHCASKKGYLDLVRWFVEERSSNLDIVDINLNSALHLAAHGGHSSIVKYLLKKGANSLLLNKWNKTAEQEGEYYGQTICRIFHAIRSRDVFEMVIDGIDWWFQYHFGSHSPNQVDENGASLLYIACRHGQTSVAKWLLEHGANVNIKLRQDSGSTPLHGAAFHGHVSTVELLLTYGADVNIKNNYGATIFDEETPDAIKIILEQYRRNLKTDKILPIYIYAGKISGIDKDEPIAKIHLRYDAKENDLLEALPEAIRNQKGYFSIAKRLLSFATEDTTVLSAVCYSRYVRSKFVDIPIHLTFSTGKPYKTIYDISPIDSNFDHLAFKETFEIQSTSSTLIIKSSIDTEQTYQVGNLSFSIAAGSNNKDVFIDTKYINVSNFRWNNLPGCLCLFKVTYTSRNRLKEPPVVSFLNETNVRLYTLALPSPYWFTYDIRQKRLPIVEGIHGFFRHVDIIPSLLSLPADMFLEMMIGQPLITRNDPLPCKYLKIRERNPNSFQLTAYHGTRLDVVQSILLDGLVVPGTVVVKGMRVKPPPTHIPLYMNANNMPNFAGAIFVSPSIHYSIDPVYSTSFLYENKRLLPVIECSVKDGSYGTFRSTLPQYVPHPSDNINTIEWRTEDPNNLQITGVLFVIKESDQSEKS